MAPLVESGLAAVLPGLAGIAHSADVLDMPVDPNEPTYCLCHQVSYGEMIGCDNVDVCIIKMDIILKRQSSLNNCIFFFSVQLNGFILLVLI